MRFDDSFETDMDMIMERMNDRIEVVMDKKMSNVDWNELIQTEMVKTVVEAEDCYGLHLHGVRVVLDRHEAGQSLLYANPSRA
ncbi:hypothetical protein Tco_1105016 [Tanacetum coccineum]